MECAFLTSVGQNEIRTYVWSSAPAIRAYDLPPHIAVEDIFPDQKYKKRNNVGRGGEQPEQNVDSAYHVKNRYMAYEECQLILFVGK